MDYDALAKGMANAVPFLGTIGLEYVELGPGTATVRLPDDPGLRNHVGSQHAAGLFAAAETASGGAFVSVFAERLAELTPLARAARIDYERIAKGPIDARATLENGDGLLEALDRDGKVEFPIDVELVDVAGERVAGATVEWHVRLRS